MNRNHIIIKTSIIGILANVFLALVKAFAGMLAGSLSIILDAINNLSDALSSLITIIGTKLAGKKPDKKHPLGYGRVEYFSATFIAFIILYAGITSLKESLLKIIHPSIPDYSYITLIIISLGVVVKIILGNYVKAIGKKVNSDSLIASGQDATLDSIISTSTLLAALIYMFIHINLEAYLGIIISIVIIKSGIETLHGTISQLLGERITHELSLKVKAIVNSFEDVHGAYDLILHAYGPDQYQGSIHIAVMDTLTAAQFDTLTRNIQKAVYEQAHVLLTGIGLYAINTTDDEIKNIQSQITRYVMSYDSILQMHGFYVDKEKQVIQFDIIIDFKENNRNQLYQSIVQGLKELYPDYTLLIQLDNDISD